MFYVFAPPSMANFLRASKILGTSILVPQQGGWPRRKILGRIWVPLDKSEGVVKAQNSSAVFFTPRCCQRVEDEDSGNVTVNHFPVKRIVSPTIDTA